MNLTLDLPVELENELAADASRLGISLNEYVLQRLSTRRPEMPRLMTGAEILDFWEREGVLGSRSDVIDVEAYSRALREESQRRVR